MSQYFQIHPTHPQRRLAHQAAEILRRGGVMAWPTDSSYALACLPDNKAGLDRIRTIRRLADGHNMTLVCRDLSELATYARVDNSVFRLLKAFTPGPYTFILPGTRELPRRLVAGKRRTIGLRVPEHPVTEAILAEVDGPLLSTSLILPGEREPLSEPEDIRDRIGHQLDLVVDGGAVGLQASTVVDLTSGAPEVIRRGAGDPEAFLAHA